VEVNTNRNRRRSRCHCVCDLMSPGQLKLNVGLILTVPTVMDGEGISTLSITDGSGCPNTLLERLDRRPGQYLGLGTPPHRPDKRIVNVQNGPPMRWQGLHQLTFGLRDRRLATELPDVGLTDVQHQTDAWWCDLAEVGDMANPSRTHLRHEESGLLVDASDRERHTELVVEIADCRHGRTGALQHLRQ
jgi:hypothetical protein